MQLSRSLESEHLSVQSPHPSWMIFGEQDPDDDWPKSSGYPIDGDGEPAVDEEPEESQESSEQ